MLDIMRSPRFVVTTRRVPGAGVAGGVRIEIDGSRGTAIAAGIALLALAMTVTGGCSHRTTTAPATATLSGTARDTAGAPVSRLMVAAQLLSVAHGGLEERRTTTTDASGRFQFGPVAPGRWVVSGGDGDRAAADTADVPGPPAALRLDSAGAVGGRVMSGGTPIAGAIVYIDTQTAYAFTAAGGHFLLGSVAPGGWWLYVRDDAGARDTAVRITVRAPADTQVVPDIVFP